MLQDDNVIQDVILPCKNNNGKIYKITSPISNRIYIGSTCKLLRDRFGLHKSGYKRFETGKSNHYISSYEILKLDNPIIELIEDYPCKSNIELRIRERYYIELNKNICVNKCVPNRSQKEYYQANKEKHNANCKEYQQANKEAIAKRKKKYREANIEKITIYAKQHYQQSRKKNIAIV